MTRDYWRRLIPIPLWQVWLFWVIVLMNFAALVLRVLAWAIAGWAIR